MLLEIAGERTLVKAKHEDMIELESLCGVNGHELHDLGIACVGSRRNFDRAACRREPLHVLEELVQGWSGDDRLLPPFLQKSEERSDRGSAAVKAEAPQNMVNDLTHVALSVLRKCAGLRDRG